MLARSCRFPVLVVGVISTATEARAQTWKPIAVHSCAAADSVLGPATNPTDGEVQWIYDAGRDTLYLLAGHNAGRSGQTEISTAVRLKGVAAASAPSTQLTALFRGAQAREVFADSTAIPALSLVLDDSVVLPFGTIQRERYTGQNQARGVPLVMSLGPSHFLEVARAGKLEIRIGTFGYEVPLASRRNLAALYRVAVCGQTAASPASRDPR